MNVVILQLMTIGSAALVLVSEWIALRFTTDMGEDYGEVVWLVQADRIGTARNCLWNRLMRGKPLQPYLGLSEGCYTAGNRFLDELYVDASGSEARIYLNVQKSKIYLTVLKGSVSVDNYTCHADRSSRIEIDDCSRVRMADVELQFCRRR